MNREANKQILTAAVEQFLDHLEEQEEFEEGQMGIVAVVAEIGFSDDEGEEMIGHPFWCSDPRRFVQVGLFQVATQLALEGTG